MVLNRDGWSGGDERVGMEAEEVAVKLWKGWEEVKTYASPPVSSKTSM